MKDESDAEKDAEHVKKVAKILAGETGMPKEPDTVTIKLTHSDILQAICNYVASNKLRTQHISTRTGFTTGKGSISAEVDVCMFGNRDDLNAWSAWEKENVSESDAWRRKRF